MVGMMGWNRVVEATYNHEHPMQQGIMGGGSGAVGWRKGPWTPEEDKLLSDYVIMHGEGRWSSVSKSSGLNRSGKSCRLRWVNYLRPGLKRGQLSPQEEGIIIELHSLWGNKWSTIARYLPGRTDNEIKNYWRTHFKKKDTKPSVTKQMKQQQMAIEEDDEDDHNMLSGSKDDASSSFQAESSFDISNNYSQYDNGQYSAAAAVTSSALDDQMMYEHYAAATWNYHVQPEERNVELWTGLWNLDDSSQPSACMDGPNQGPTHYQAQQSGHPLFF